MIPRYFTAFALVGLFIGLAMRKRPSSSVAKKTSNQANSGEMPIPVQEPARREDGRYSSH